MLDDRSFIRTTAAGIGWNYVEYEALGQDFRTRNKRIEEQIGLLRDLWTTPVLSFEGRFDKVDRAGINPRPRRSIPIWLGEHSEAAYRRGAQFGEGFIFAAFGIAALEAWESTKRHLAEFGRAEQGFGRELLSIFARDARTAADDLKTWRDAGGSHGCAPSMGMGFGSSIDAHIAYLAEVKRLVDHE